MARAEEGSAAIARSLVRDWKRRLTPLDRHVPLVAVVNGGYVGSPSSRTALGGRDDEPLRVAASAV